MAGSWTSLSKVWSSPDRLVQISGQSVVGHRQLPQCGLAAAQEQQQCSKVHAPALAGQPADQSCALHQSPARATSHLARSATQGADGPAWWQGCSIRAPAQPPAGAVRPATKLWLLLGSGDGHAVQTMLAAWLQPWSQLRCFTVAGILDSWPASLAACSSLRRQCGG